MKIRVYYKFFLKVGNLDTYLGVTLAYLMVNVGNLLGKITDLITIMIRVAGLMFRYF